VRVVIMIVIAIVTAVRVAVMMLVVGQQPGAGEVHREAHARDRDRLIELDRHRVEEPHDRLVGDQDRDQCQDDGARKGCQLAKLAGAERESRVIGVAAGETVGKRRDHQCGDVGRHMRAVGDDRHRTEQAAADKLDHHGGGGQCHHQPGAPLVVGVFLAEEDVAVAPTIERMGMHGEAPRGPSPFN